MMTKPERRAVQTVLCETLAGGGLEVAGSLGGLGRSGIPRCALKSLEARRQQGPLLCLQNNHPQARTPTVPLP